MGCETKIETIVKCKKRVVGEPIINWNSCENVQEKGGLFGGRGGNGPVGGGGGSRIMGQRGVRGGRCEPRIEVIVKMKK